MGLYGDVIFPWLIDHLEGPELRELRARTVREVRGDVLEIGFGTGANLPHYPEAVRSLTAVEPAHGMNRRAKRRIAGSSLSVTLVPGAGERLPLEDSRYDAVVMTITLCTVEDPSGVLGEIRRVLRPGGRYHFFEHVASTDPSIRRWQDRLNGFSRWIGCGCNLNRDTEAAIRRAGFSFERLEHVLTRAMPVPKLYPLIVGVGVR